MDQKKLTKSIKENKGILKQLTSLNNKIKELRGRIRKLEDMNKVYPNEVELARMHLREGTDPD